MSSNKRTAFSHIQNNSNGSDPAASSTPVSRNSMKKSSSLKLSDFNDDGHLKLKDKSKLRTSNSFDHSTNAPINEEIEDELSFLASSSSKKSSIKIFRDASSKKHDIEIQCDIENDFIQNLVDNEFSEEELQIKEKNPETFLRLIAEKLRAELFDHLQENMELHKIKEELKDEHQVLMEEKTRLLNLVETANDLFNTYKDMANEQPDDSGLNC